MASSNRDMSQPADDQASSADLARLNAISLRSRDARARRTIDRLREGLLSLIETVTLEAITVDDIVAAAKVSRSTFYRHFATKEAFVEDIAETEIQNFVGYTFPLLSSSDSTAACLAVVTFVHERRKLWSILLNGGAAGFMRSRFIRLAAQVGPGQLGGAPLALPLDLGAAFGVAATVEVLSWWLRQPEPVPLEEVAALVNRLAVRPALNPSR